LILSPEKFFSWPTCRFGKNFKGRGNFVPFWGKAGEIGGLGVGVEKYIINSS